MAVAPLAIGDSVHTPLGAGVVRELRRRDEVLVQVGQASVVFPAIVLRKIEERRRRPRSSSVEDRREVVEIDPRGGPSSASSPSLREIDLHGLTVDEAMIRVEERLNAALLADVSEVRFIHGRSGGRIRAALHERLRRIPSVRGFRLDPRNEGVTVVHL